MDFTISLQGTNPDTNLLQGTANPGRIVTMDPGAYRVAENEDPTAYDTSYSAGCTGTLGLGEMRDCVITNNDKPTAALGGPGTNVAGGTGGANATSPGTALNSTQLLSWD